MWIDYEGAILDLDPRDDYQRRLLRRAVKRLAFKAFRKPFRSDDYLTLASGLLSDGRGVVIDVGCNIGATALPLAKQFPEARIIAVDPHPVAAGRFTRNMWRNNLTNVTFVGAAIAPSPGVVEISSCPSNSGGHRVTGFAGRVDIVAPPGMLRVPGVRLDALLDQLGVESCRLLKVDVEGFEVQVLESAGDYLAPGKIENVVCEYGPEGMRSAGHDGWDMVRLMQARGYGCVDIHSGKRIDRTEDVPSLADFAVTDFLFTRAAVMSAVSNAA